MGVDLVTYRGRIGSFIGKWTNMAASRIWEKGCGMKKCSLSLCIAMSFISICGMDIETNTRPMQIRLKSFEQKDTRNSKSQEQGSEQGASHWPTEVILEDILLKMEGFNGRFDQIGTNLNQWLAKWRTLLKSKQR